MTPAACSGGLQAGEFLIRYTRDFIESSPSKQRRNQVSDRYKIGISGSVPRTGAVFAGAPLHESQVTKGSKWLTKQINQS
jgi:hypothetical protein